MLVQINSKERHIKQCEVRRYVVSERLGIKKKERKLRFSVDYLLAK